MSNEILKTKEENFMSKSKGLKVFCKILRLLQLFCEGHNLHLQKYLSFQENSKINYNLVALTMESLDVLSISNQNFITISQCLDSMTEYMQGPCEINQEKIANGKFLQYAVEILNVVFIIFLTLFSSYSCFLERQQ